MERKNDDNKDIYVRPTIDNVGVVEPQSLVWAAVAAVFGAFVWDGIVLVNYGVAVNVGGGLNVAVKTNAVVN